jgi:hypothetical protein
MSIDLSNIITEMRLENPIQAWQNIYSARVIK